MSNPVVSVFDLVVNEEIPAGRSLWVWCPGCEAAHQVAVLGRGGDKPYGPCWDWNGEANEKLTITPSILVHGVPGKMVRCHSNITDGKWYFHPDSEHKLANQTVPLVPLPDWLAR